MKPKTSNRSESVRKSLALTMLILAGACFIMTASVLVMLYRSELASTTKQLEIAAHSQKSLIEAVTEYDKKEGQLYSDHYPDSDRNTIEQIKRAYKHYKLVDSNISFELVRIEGDSLVVYASLNRIENENAEVRALDNQIGEAIKRTQTGEHGVAICYDHRGTKVIVACEPVEMLGMAIVAKTEIAALREPFINALNICIILSLIVITGGGYLIIRSTKPLVEGVRKRAALLENEIEVRLNLERELRESESRLRTIFDHIGEGIIVADPDEKFLFANPAAHTIFGMSNGDLLGRNFKDFVDDKQFRLIQEQTSKRSSGERTQYEVEINAADGKKRTILITATPELDDKENLTAEFGIISDITSVRESQALLRWLNRAVETTNEVIFMTDSEGVFIYINPAFTHLYGYKPHEVIGVTTPRILNAGEKEPEYYENFWKTILSGNLVKDEIINKTSSGKLVTVANSVNAVFNEQGEVEAILAVQRDITEQMMAEFQLMEYTQEVEALVGKEQELTAELKQSLEDLEQSKAETENALKELKVAQAAMVQSEKMASIGVLAAGIAHEINNPVGYVANNLRELQNYTHKIQEYLTSVAKLEESVDKNDIETARRLHTELKEAKELSKLDFILDDLSDLITDSLQGTGNIETIVKSLKLFSRKDDDEMIPINLREIIDNSIRVVNNQLKYHAEVIIESEDIPEVMGQIGGLQQVFSNLLVNAVQAIEGNGRITIRINRAGGMVAVQLEDTGCGIPQENLDRIFEPFYTTKDVGKGTGLGLSIVFDIIKKHNGRIEVESEPDVGTTFTIHLPVAIRASSKEFGETQ